MAVSVKLLKNVEIAVRINLYNKIKMRKQGELMPSLVLERLPKAVIAALEGPSVKQDLLLLQSLPALDMTTVAMLLRRKIHYPMPLLQVSLERLPDSVMSNLVSKKKGSAVIPLSDVTTPSNSLLSTKISRGPTLPSLEVALQRIPDTTMTSLLAHRKAILLAGKGKKKIGQLKNSRKM